MMIYWNLFILVAVVALTYGQEYSNSSDNYINENRRRYDANIRDNNLQIKLFEELYVERIKTIDIQMQMLVSALQQSHQNLYPLERLGDFSKKCVNKYKVILPEANAARTNLTICSSEANNQMENLVSGPRETNNDLANYYENTFEMEISNCKKNYSATDREYALCITNVISNADIYSMGNQEAFALRMDSAWLLADVYVNQALECSYAIHADTVSLMAKANTLIERCLRGWDDCAKCTGNFCENTLYMPGNTIDSKNQTMINPFFGRNDTIHCLMMNIV